MSSTDNLTTMLLIVLAIDMFMVLGSAAVTAVNPDGATVGIECDDTLLDIAGNCATGEIQQNVSRMLPTAANKEDRGDTAPGFTDIFQTIWNWLLKLPVIGQLLQMVAAPFALLTAMGLPLAAVYAIAGFWYVVNLFLLVAFLVGR